VIAARQGDRAVASNVLRFSMAVDGASVANVTGKFPGSINAGSIYCPVDASGCARIHPLAASFVDRIAFDQLMLKTERSEQGAIGAGLDRLFRGRLIAVQTANGTDAIRLAALRNGLTECPPPIWLTAGFVLLVVTLPWWRGGRGHRVALALGVSCAAALLALAVYQEWRILLPLAAVALLPLLAIIPGAAARRSDKVEERKLPA
jgi:hypothetical protein